MSFNTNRRARGKFSSPKWVMRLLGNLAKGGSGTAVGQASLQVLVDWRYTYGVGSVLPVLGCADQYRQCSQSSAAQYSVV